MRVNKTLKKNQQIFNLGIVCIYIFGNITVMQDLLKIGCVFFMGFSSCQCQYEFHANITQYLYKNKKTTSNVKTSRTINYEVDRAFP